MMAVIPKGWSSGKLNEIVYSIKTGVNEYEGEKEYYSTGSIRRSTLKSEGTFSFLSRPSRANRIAELFDVFQARMKETDKGLIITEELVGQLFSTGFLQLRPYLDTYFSRLLFYFVKSHDFLHQRDALATGSTQEALTDTNSKELIFPFPPINEQKRIAAKLDQIMPKIDGLKDRLGLIPQIIKRFRQSVLTATVTGKLTENWRDENPDVKNAEVLFSHIQAKKDKLSKYKKILKFKDMNSVDESDMDFEIPKTWKWCRLEEITMSISTGPFGSMLHQSDYITGGVPVINPMNIIGELIIPTDNVTVSLETKARLVKYELKKGNIVLARRGDLSKCGIVTDNEEGWLGGTGSFFLEVGIESKYFCLFYSSNFCQSTLNKDAVGSTMQNLNQKVLSNIHFPLPPLEEQREIVRQVNKLFAFADKLEAHYKKAKEKLDKLPQSVLAKAFRGELVPQDPNDEPVEILLERIKREKARLEIEMKKTRRNSARLNK